MHMEYFIDKTFIEELHRESGTTVLYEKQLKKIPMQMGFEDKIDQDCNEVKVCKDKNLLILYMLHYYRIF